MLIQIFQTNYLFCQSPLRRQGQFCLHSIRILTQLCALGCFTYLLAASIFLSKKSLPNRLKISTCPIQSFFWIQPAKVMLAIARKVSCTEDLNITTLPLSLLPFLFFCTCSLVIARLSLWLAQSSQTVALFSSLGSSSFALAQEAPIYRISQLFSTGHTARHGVMTAVAVVCFRINRFLDQ